MPELRDEWNLKATTINDSVKNQLESTGLHAPWMRTEWRVFLFRYYSLTVSSSTYWRPHNSLLAHSQITLIRRFSSKRETSRSLPTPCCVSIILKHRCRPGRSPPPPIPTGSVASTQNLYTWEERQNKTGSRAFFSKHYSEEYVAGPALKRKSILITAQCCPVEPGQA